MVISRAYRDEADYDRLRRFLQHLPDMAAEGGNCTIGDLDWWRFTHEHPDKIRDVQLWLDDGETVIGWVWPDVDTYDCFIDPRHAKQFPVLLAWSEARAREQGNKTLSLICNDRDEQRKDVLVRAGYQPGEFHFVYRGQALTDDLKPAVLPPGFRFHDMRTAYTDSRLELTKRELQVQGLLEQGKSVEEMSEALFIGRRTVETHIGNITIKTERLKHGGPDIERRAEQEIERRVELHRAVWAPSKMTVAKHHAVMSSPTYRPDLDLIVVAPNGDLAAYAIVWHDTYNRIGVFEPVGCHPDYRQRGLTRAIMLEGMARLRKLGAKMAFVNSLYNSVPANRLYESSGFQIVDRQRKWTKSLT